MRSATASRRPPRTRRTSGPPWDGAFAFSLRVVGAQGFRLEAGIELRATGTSIGPTTPPACAVRLRSADLEGTVRRTLIDRVDELASLSCLLDDAETGKSAALVLRG